MSQQDFKSASILPNGCGCLLLLMGIGVIGAIAVPSFLVSGGGGCRPKRGEAIQYVGSMNRAQKVLFIEKSAFATSVDALGLGIKTETTNFKYSIRATKKAAFNYGVSKKKDLKSYVGGVFLVPSKNLSKMLLKRKELQRPYCAKLIFPVQLNQRNPPMKMVKLLVVKAQHNRPDNLTIRKIMTVDY
jgi:hypothetical protein